MGEHRVFIKCAWRLMPLICVIYVMNYIDRVNLGFAALTMNADLGLSPSDFGFAAGIFFFSYMVCQIPANALLGRIGARRWFAVILAAWGAVTVATALVRNTADLAIIRLLLGIAEAGFYPGIMYYLTLWFPQAFRVRFAAFFIASQPISFIIGGPLAALILEMDGYGGLHGWQWLFVIEGVPTVLLALAAFLRLPDGPADAPWLDADEKRTIADRLASSAPSGDPSFVGALLDVRVWVLAVATFSGGAALYANALWLPQIVSGLGYSNSETGMVVALIYLVGMFVMIGWAYDSDRRGERIWHTVIPWCFAVVGYLVVSISVGPIGSLFALAVAVICVQAVVAPSNTLATLFLSGPAFAAAIALQNTSASLGGLVAPVIIGILRERSGGYSSSMAALAFALLAGAAVVLLLGRLLKRPVMAQREPSVAP